MTGEESLPRIKDRVGKRSNFRRFTTKSALRNRDRRSSARKDVPKLCLPELESDDSGSLGWNSELTRLKLNFALASPNVSQTERSNQPRKDLTAISHKAKFHSQISNGEQVHHGKSPYAMNDHSAHKYFMSGYQGVVPGCRFMLGESFPSLTHEALNNFTTAIKERNIRLTKPLQKSEVVPQSARSVEDLKREERISKFLLYRSHTGITPNYKGFIPGHKYRFGRTFGQITKDPLNRESTAYLTAR